MVPVIVYSAIFLLALKVHVLQSGDNKLWEIKTGFFLLFMMNSLYANTENWLNWNFRYNIKSTPIEQTNSMNVTGWFREFGMRWFMVIFHKGIAES